MYSLLIILTIAVGVARSSSYIKDKLCNEPHSLYEYTLSGEMHDHRGKEVAVTTCNVELQCMSEGAYGGQQAMHYCIKLENVVQKMFEVKINQVTMKQTKYLKSAVDATSSMKNDFCFLRGKDGSLLKVFHPRNERMDIVNLKKAIVSAFQANFAKTKTKEETDAQSKHTSHYKYESKGSNTVEHRTIDSKDVSKYSGNARKKGVDYHSKEDIEVDKNKIIRKAQGESTTSLTKENKKEEKITGKNSDIPPIETKSKYTLKLIKKLPHAMIEANEEQTLKLDQETTKMDDVIAQYDEYEEDQEDMKELHEQLTDIQVMAKRMTRSVNSDSSSNNMADMEQHVHALQKWRELLHLEAKHGPLEGKKPKMETIVDTLKEVWLENTVHSYNLRMIIYDLLSSEGSLTAQQALMDSLRMKQIVEHDEEYHNIVTAISLLESVGPESLFDYKQYVIANGTTDEQLLLSLATLGRHKNVEQEVVDTITQLIEEQGVNDTDTLIYFIHALGNTGSRLIIPYLTPLLLNTDTQVTVIDALRTVSTDKRVQMMFSDLCRSSGVPVDTVLAIIESVRFPHESFLYYPESPEEPEDDEVEKQLIMNIVNATIRIQDTRLFNATKMYLQATTTEFSSSLLNDLIVQYHNESSQRSKRSYTRDWSSTTSSIYNYIASSSTRSADKSNYRYHKAFLWGKQLGPSKVHAKFVAGGFAGVGRSGYKVYGKAFVQLYCFGKTYTALNGYYTNQYNLKTRAKEVRRYVNFLGRTYIDTSATTQARVRLPYQRTWSRNLGSRRLFYIRYRIFVYVGILKFYIRGDVTLDAALSINMKTIEAKSQIQFGPTFIVTGGVSLRILRYRVGIRVSARIGYYIKPMASVTMCDDIPKADVSACFGIFHGSNGLKVDVYAYYKKLRCRIRRWRLRCWWTGDYRVRRLSSTYNVGGVSNRLYWGQCFACSCRGLLHQYCSAHRGVPGTASRCYCRSTRFQ